MRESDIQRSCVALARSEGLVVLNVHGGGWGAKGFPDLVVMGRGRVLCVELKNPESGYRLKPDQAVWRDRLAGAGVPWALCRSLSEFETEIGKVFR